MDPATALLLTVLLFASCPSGAALRGALVRAGRAFALRSEHELFDPLTGRIYERATTPSTAGFLRFGRSLYAPEGAAVLRSQRGVHEEPVLVIDADDGQLMRYGRKK